ncbi:S1/P1 nuclease [Tundrisphaera lichenicola]|uniref:S1/P1 nuclease n=1 Tax=Tundrisphaera lichenicola TaxID=2029860 RepID=UPI003EBD81E9
MSQISRKIVLFLTAFSLGSPAFGWGPQGHRVIAKVAADRLTPAARAAIRDLLLEGDTLPDIAGWADHEGYDKYPRSGPWHYVNVPITADRFDPARDCRDGNCVVEKIKHYRKVLANRSVRKEDRQVALLFLVHFVSDIHQPLHVGDNRDHGGNDTQVQFLGEGTNLHRLWDSGLIHRIGGNDREWVTRIERRITPESSKAWSKAGVEDWANESLQTAKIAYDPSRKLGPMTSGARLESDYLKAVEPLLIDQMARAGVRLADELNAIFP